MFMTTDVDVLAVIYMNVENIRLFFFWQDLQLPAIMILKQAK